MITVEITEQQLNVAINLMRVGARALQNDEFDAGAEVYLGLRQLFIEAVRKSKDEKPAGGNSDK